LKIIFDASSLINLVNGEGFDIVLAIQDHEFYLGPLVYSESGPGCEAKIGRALGNKKLTLLDDNEATSSVFLDLLERFGLGDGETECLAFSVGTDFVVCSDDRKARQICEIIIGKEKVTGSLGLLREAVHLGLRTADEAFEIYIKMKTAGGFLPDIDLTFFRAR
jgi:predicted nucleic acid-binding protein